MEIRLSRMEDKENIKKLWNANKQDLSIPFNIILDRLIDENRFYVVYDGNNFVGMGGFKVMKKEPVIRIEHLCVNQEYRNKGIATKILKKIIDNVEAYNLPIICKCRDGAENNSYYSKFTKQDYIMIHQKTIDLRLYILDKELIKNKGEKYE